jgi:hypothetical protein
VRPCQGRSRGFKSRLPLQISVSSLAAGGGFVYRVTIAFEAKFFRFPEARYPSGKGEVCKTFMHGFESHPRLQSFQSFTSPIPSCWLPLTEFPLSIRLLCFFSVQLGAERFGSKLRRLVDDVGVALEKKVGTECSLRCCAALIAEIARRLCSKPWKNKLRNQKVPT